MFQALVQFPILKHQYNILAFPVEGRRNI